MIPYTNTQRTYFQTWYQDPTFQKFSRWLSVRGTRTLLDHLPSKDGFLRCSLEKTPLTAQPRLRPWPIRVYFRQRPSLLSFLISLRSDSRPEHPAEQSTFFYSLDYTACPHHAWQATMSSTSVGTAAGHSHQAPARAGS